MCGICGFNWEDKKILKEMTDIISHRGPDQYDYYTDDLVSFGHRRLSIIDLSEKGKQPLCNEDGTIWIVYNGEIYNFQDIKLDLEKKGHFFKSNTDTEVIIHAYEEYGIECVKLFNGMFSFAIWDSLNKKIIFARDRLGVKPLYYYFDKINNKLIFASEIKSILSNPLVKKEINLNAFNQILHYAYIINGETIFKNINELPPGKIMIYDFNNLEIKEYWKIDNNVHYGSENFFAEKLKQLLAESVRKRLVADVPLGASLSGGLDSSSIVAFMSRITEKPIETFTVGFDDESDEFKEAKLVSEFCKTNHHEKIIPLEEITKNLAKILWHMEVPYAKPAVFATYFLSKEINRNKVIIDLSGEGSDEIFGGYNRYGRDKTEKIITSPFVSEEHKKRFFNKSVLTEVGDNLIPANNFLPELEKQEKEEHLNVALNFELRKQLPGVQLTRVDKMSMAHSHEIRVPFLDYEFVEFGMTIPSNLKWKNNNKKYILQKAMEPLLPKEIINRNKVPFHAPLLKYFQEGFIDVADNILSSSSIFKKEFVNQDKIKEQIRSIRNKEITDDKSLRQILFLTNFELFQRIFIERDKIKSTDLEINNFL
ncbi:asparagine synthase (glutamine-hydrolyzing) [Candidatus Pacearchaeota archaeon]|nr:asparagine synthase (glutamine-hydrolyzing) [Candidatus Pacearchaeota archaeon]